MTTEEEEVLAQMLEERKAKRKADISEHKRRSKFDPLAAAEKRKAVAAATDGAAVRDPPLSQTAARVLPSGPQHISGARTAAPPAGARRDPLPRKLNAGTAPSPRTLLFSSKPAGGDRPNVDDYGDDDEEEIDEAEFEAAALAFLREEEEEKKESVRAGDEPPASSAGAARQNRASPALSPPAGRPRTVVAPGAFKPGSSRAPGASAISTSSLRLGPSTPPSASGATPRTSPSTAARGAAQRRTAAPPRKRGSAGALASTALGGLDLSALESLSKEQLEAILADDMDDHDGSVGEMLAGGGAGEAEELDWDTLEAGESFEKYLAELETEAEDKRVRRARNVAASKGGKGAGSAALKVASKIETMEDALGEDNQAADDAEFDQLLKLFEMVEEEEVAAAGSPPGGKDSGRAAGGGKKKGGKAQEIEEDIDWGMLEKMFLGEGWDREIIEMAEKVMSAQKLLAAEGQMCGSYIGQIRHLISLASHADTYLSSFQHAGIK